MAATSNSSHARRRVSNCAYYRAFFACAFSCARISSTVFAITSGTRSAGTARRRWADHVAPLREPDLEAPGDPFHLTDLRYSLTDEGSTFHAFAARFRVKDWGYLGFESEGERRGHVASGDDAAARSHEMHRATVRTAA